MAQHGYTDRTANAIYMTGGTLNIDQGGTISVDYDGKMPTNMTSGGVYLNGGTVNVNGTFDITGKNLGDSSNLLLYAGSAVNITNGNMNISIADGSGNMHLVNGNAFNVSNPGTSGINFDLGQNTGSGSALFGSGTMIAKNVSVNHSDKYLPYYDLNIPMGGGTVTGNGMNGYDSNVFNYSLAADDSKTKRLELRAIPDFGFVPNSNDVKLDSNGNYVLTGNLQTINSSPNFNNSQNSIYLRMLDKNGNPLPGNTYPNTEDSKDVDSANKPNVYTVALKNNSQTDGTIQYQISLPKEFDLTQINNYQVQGHYVISNHLNQIDLSQDKINDVIAKRATSSYDDGVAAFF